MMKKLLFALFACMLSLNVSAQTVWTGVNYQDLEEGETVFLYNVGTGRFLIHGGDWGTQARLFYKDTGKTLTWTISNGKYLFKTGVNTGDAAVLGCNVPTVTSSHAWTGNGDQETFTILMDANENYSGTNNVSGKRGWNFIPVEDGDGVYTYYMYETLGDSTVYLGAAYGENWDSHEGDPNGNLTLLSSSYDKAVWTTADPRLNVVYQGGLKPVEGEGTYTRTMSSPVPIFNADTQIPLRDLYKWRIVTLEQIEALANPNNDVVDGLTTNLTYLIYDRGLERNDWSFFTYWKAGSFSDKTYSTSDYRYGYTWGLEGNATSHTEVNNQSTRRKSEGWNRPVRLKSQWTSKTDAKYGFLEFEGMGTVSTSIVAPARGIYMITAYGFYQGANKGYLFASKKDPSANNFSTSDIIAMTELPVSSTTYTKSTSAGVMEAGRVFVGSDEDKAPYLVSVEIETTSNNETIYFGVCKLDATKSSQDDYYRGDYYYHDTDWVCADQFQMFYLGSDDPVVFDEEQTSLDYLAKDYKNRSVRLKRTFVNGAWNTFTFPLDLSAEQVRNAFGDNVRVASLDGLGTLSNIAKCIDFKSVSLPNEGTAIKANKFYLIYPNKTPLTSSDGTYTYYDMGKFTFNSEGFESTEEVTVGVNPDAAGYSSDINKVTSIATYVRSSNYDKATCASSDNGVYIPARAYVMGSKKDSNGNYTSTYMTRINNPMPVKGFRGWLVNAAANSSSEVKITNISLNGNDFGEATSIEGIFINEPLNEGIYDLTGRRIANDAQTLNKGVYIINGKKYIVK